MSMTFSSEITLTPKELLRELANLKEKIYELESERRNYKKIANQYKSIFPKIENPMLLTDVDGKIIDANSKFIDFFGYTLYDLRRMSIRSLTPNNLHENENKILLEEIAESNKIESRWCELFKINGEKVQVEFEVQATYDDNGKLDGITRIVKNIL